VLPRLKLALRVVDACHVLDLPDARCKPLLAQARLDRSDDLYNIGRLFTLALSLGIYGFDRIALVEPVVTARNNV